MAESVTVESPAKLNLALSVGPPEAGGMHPVCTWMVTVDLCDELRVTRLEDDRLSRYAILWHPDARRPTEIDWPVARDLAVRAHLALEQRVGRYLPVQMRLRKRIPVGGGLGGGSSNAAAMLRATNVLFELGLSDAELSDLAVDLGSDVPFFVRGGSAIVEGFGERLEHHDEVREIFAVIAFPEASCKTGSIYAAYDQLEPGALQARRIRGFARGDGRLPPESVFNDLARAALRVEPRLGDLLARLAEIAERPAHVAGSGSSLFMVCDDALHAETLAGAIEERLELPAVPVRSIKLRGDA